MQTFDVIHSPVKLIHLLAPVAEVAPVQAFLPAFLYVDILQLLVEVSEVPFLVEVHLP